MATKYRDDFPERAFKMAHAGMIDDQIAKELGIAKDTFYRYQKIHPEFKKALSDGKQRPDDIVEAALYKNAIGYDYEEIKTREQIVSGKKRKIKEVTKKHIPGNVTAQIFWLKNRRRDRWKDKWEIDFDELNIKVNLVDD